MYKGEENKVFRFDPKTFQRVDLGSDNIVPYFFYVELP